MISARLHIAYSTSGEYFPLTQVAASSAIALASDRSALVVHIFDCGICDCEWEKYEQCVRNRFGDKFGLVRHKIDLSRYAAMRSWHGSFASYIRIETSEIIRDSDWALFADGDTLFLSDPLALREYFNDDYAIIGHKDCPGANQPGWWRKNGFDWDGQIHVCAGFMLMNLRWLRDNNIFKKCFELLGMFPDIPNIDQDVLNITCSKKLELLPDWWGCFDFSSSPDVARGAIHYVSSKPWNSPKTLPISSPVRVWLAAAENFCGHRPWRVWGVPIAKYLGLSVRSFLWISVRRFLNAFVRRGVYDGVLRACWTSKELMVVRRKYVKSMLRR